ncbi:MAG: ExbD/TolR family protein [Candidatus Gastranaerophilaceae bacterium]
MARQSRQVFSDINITPLTDIFLVLLIIMMVIAPLLDQQGLSLTVPDNVDADKVKEHKTVNIVIDNEDKFFIDNNEISANDLEKVIKEQIKINPEGVIIQTSDETTNGAMVKVMDSARNVGVTAISVSEM